MGVDGQEQGLEELMNPERYLWRYSMFLMISAVFFNTSPDLFNVTLAQPGDPWMWYQVGLAGFLVGVGILVRGLVHYARHVPGAIRAFSEQTD
jgi:bacteriorhodopsin